MPATAASGTRNQPAGSAAMSFRVNPMRATATAMPTIHASQSLTHFRHYFGREQAERIDHLRMRHADPVHRQDHAVDPQTSIVADDLLGNLVGRAEQEAVAGELVKAEREVVVALGHHLVLSPLSVDLVLLLQVRT